MTTMTTQPGLSGKVITGTANVDELIGTELDDIIFGLGYWDELFGGAGNDKLYGGDEWDMLYGGAGNDYLDGGNEGDTLVDFEGNNVLEGGKGNDNLQAGAGNTIMRGGEGDDRIDAYGGGRVEAFGGEGDDWLILSDHGNYGDVLAWGDDGNDHFEFRVIEWSKVNIIAHGGAGRDTFAPMPSHNRTSSPLRLPDFTSGADGDMLDVSHLLGYDWTAGNPFGLAGKLRFIQRGLDTVLQQYEEVMGDRVFIDVLTLPNIKLNEITADNITGRYAPFMPPGTPATPKLGTDLPDNLAGDKFDDTLSGGGADDRLDGAAGNDRLFGQSGDDDLRGGTGNDVLFGGDGADSLSDTTGDNIMYGDGGNDVLTSTGTGINLLYGGYGDDTLSGGLGADLLDGGYGNDTLILALAYHAATPDALRLFGGEGTDTFNVSNPMKTSAVVEASGGDGRDIFTLSATTSSLRYTVLDFKPGVGGDQFSLALLPAALQGNPFASGVLQFVQTNSYTLLRYDADGSAGSQLPVTLLALDSVQADKLTSANFTGGVDPKVPLAGLFTMGSSADDQLNGNSGDDHLQGLGGSDTLTGAAGKDTLDGGSGNDTLSGQAGDDRLFGGEGMDSAQYSGARSDYVIETTSGGLKVRATASDEGNDTLGGIERLIFSDSSVAFDAAGNAGKMFRIYQAAFDRTPDPAGLGYWIAQVDQGASMASVAAGFVQSGEFQALYGESPSNEQLVNRYYQNVLNRAPDSDGLDYWVGLLDQHRMDASGVLAYFSESPENTAAVAPLIAQGIPFYQY